MRTPSRIKLLFQDWFVIVYKEVQICLILFYFYSFPSKQWLSTRDTFSFPIMMTFWEGRYQMHQADDKQKKGLFCALNSWALKFCDRECYGSWVDTCSKNIWKHERKQNQVEIVKSNDTISYLSAGSWESVVEKFFSVLFQSFWVSLHLPLATVPPLMLGTLAPLVWFNVALLCS